MQLRLNNVYQNHMLHVFTSVPIGICFVVFVYDFFPILSHESTLQVKHANCLNSRNSSGVVMVETHRLLRFGLCFIFILIINP